MNTLSPMRTPSSSMNGTLPLGPSWGRDFSVRKASPDILSCTAVLIANGLGSGRPQSGPKA